MRRPGDGVWLRDLFVRLLVLAAEAAALVWVLLVLTDAAGAQSATRWNCGERREIVGRLESRFGETVGGGGVVAINGQAAPVVVLMTMRPDGKSWTILTVARGRACIVLTGSHWMRARKLRRGGRRDPLDWYVEERWCAERLFAVEEFERNILILYRGVRVGRIFDPSCGLGNVLQGAAGAGYLVGGADIVARSPLYPSQVDFFSSDEPIDGDIVSNPPFNQCGAEAGFRYVRHALKRLRPGGKLALLLPTVWANSGDAGRFLPTTPLLRELRLCPRPIMQRGHDLLAGEKARRWNKDFSWFIWQDGYEGRPETGWLHRDG